MKMRGMKRNFIRGISLCVLWIFFCTSAFGQIAFKEEKTKVNSIKRSTKYVYGEGIAETEAEAREIAEQNLRQAILQLVSEEKDLLEAEAVLVNAAKQNTSQIKLKRGTMDRVFLYVEKKNIFPSENPFIMEQSMPEEEKTEAEIVEQDVAEEELLDFKALEEPAEAQDVIQKVESLTLQGVLACQDMTALRAYLAEQKEAYKVMFGDVRQDFKPSWYVVVYEGEEIKAVLDKGLQRRTNLLSGTKEEIGTYSSFPKMWFIIYE